MEHTPIMYVIMNDKGKFLNVNGVFGTVFEGIRVFSDIEEAKTFCIYQEEFVVRINITISTLVRV